MPNTWDEIPQWAKDAADNDKRKCEICGQTPCVRIREKSGKIFYDGSMCGVCMWGDSDCFDPANW